MSATIDDWVSTTFGVHPASYASPGDGAGSDGTVRATPPAPDKHVDPASVELYQKQPGESGDVSDSDVHQGHIGDCFLIASMGEIAKLRPELIKKLIKDNGNGTYTVTLHKQDNGISNAWGIFSDNYKEVKVTVTADQPTDSANQWEGAGADGKKEIWPLILEKAYAQLTGGYAKLDKGGHPTDAMEALTGKSAKHKSASSVSLEDLQDAMAKGKPMVFSTAGDAKSHDADPKYGLYTDHAYIFESLEKGPGDKQYVRLKNPWGHDDPKLIPVDELGKALDSVDTGEL